MKIINGNFADAKVFSNDIEDYATAQVQMICDNEVSKNSKIRVMPDVHPGKIGPIGLTMTVGDKVIPNLLGGDIGCGISMVKIKKGRPEFQRLDTVIRENIPSGFSIRYSHHDKSKDFDFGQLICYRHINESTAVCSLGTLGGGNHFIELDKDEEGSLYLIIHSGSRSLGQRVTDVYSQKGQKELEEKGEQIPIEMAYVTGQTMDDYLHDQSILQNYAELNREIMIYEICKKMKWKTEDIISCNHNYIEINSDPIMLRKGSISAKKNEPVIIPINMRDGVILGKGLGNEDWNCSAPHGSGRVLKRTDVQNSYTVSNFKAEMKGIYSSCIGKDTLDEAPFAYRSISEIENVIKETVEVEKILKPIYNFKAGNNK